MRSQTRSGSHPNLQRFDEKLAEASADGTISRNETEQLVAKAERVIGKSGNQRLTTDAIVRRFESRATGKLIHDPRAQRMVEHAVTRFRSALDVKSAFDPSARVTLAELKEAFITAMPKKREEIDRLFANRATRAALNGVDSEGKTAAQHVMRALQAPRFNEAIRLPETSGRREDGSFGVIPARTLTPADLAFDLLSHLGAPKSASHGNCYGRTSNAIWAVYRPGEYARLTSSLLLDGRVTLPSGIRARWQGAKLPVTKANLSDFMFGTLCNNMRFKTVRDGAPLEPKVGFATKAEMANLFTRMTGERWVNVQIGPGEMNDNNPHDYYSPAYDRWNQRQEEQHKNALLAVGDKLDRIKDDLAKTGPWLAEYGCHGGSLVKFEKSRKGEVTTYSFETGGSVEKYSDIGYVVMPKAVADKAGMRPIRYKDNDPQGYLEAKSLRGLR